MSVRPNTVCLFLSQHALREEPHLVALLLREWGGEAISMTEGESRSDHCSGNLGHANHAMMEGTQLDRSRNNFPW